MEAASSGLVIDRAIEPGVQIFGWEVANAAALELGRGARQRALDALGASETPRAPSDRLATAGGSVSWTTHRPSLKRGRAIGA
jgi:hypothetical protein